MKFNENINTNFENNLKQAVDNIRSKDSVIITLAGKEMLVRDINEKYANATSAEQGEVLKDLKTLNSDEIFSKYQIDRRIPEDKVSDEMNTIILQVSEIIKSKYRTKNNSITEAGLDIIIERISDELVNDPENTLKMLKNMSKEDMDKKFF